MTYPRIPGHEIASVIAEVAPAVPDPFGVGMEATVVPCMTCGQGGAKPDRTLRQHFDPSTLVRDLPVYTWENPRKFCAALPRGNHWVCSGSSPTKFASFFASLAEFFGVCSEPQISGNQTTEVVVKR